MNTVFFRGLEHIFPPGAHMQTSMREASSAKTYPGRGRQKWSKSDLITEKMKPEKELTREGADG